MINLSLHIKRHCLTFPTGSPPVTETDSLAMLFGREIVLIPTTPPHSELLTVSCLGVKVPPGPGRPMPNFAGSFSHWKLATVWPSRPFRQEMMGGLLLFRELYWHSRPFCQEMRVGELPLFRHNLSTSPIRYRASLPSPPWPSMITVDEKAANKREAEDEKRTHDSD